MDISLTPIRKSSSTQLDTVRVYQGASMVFGHAHQVIINGLEAIELNSADGNHQCQILLHGATLISWKRNHQEKIFLSKLAVFDGKKAIRGGIPLVFPQFARPNPSMAQHGFLRTSLWSYIGSLVGDDSMTAYFRLTSKELHPEGTPPPSYWSHPFMAIYEVTLTSDSLTITLRIFNTASSTTPSIAAPEEKTESTTTTTNLSTTRTTTSSSSSFDFHMLLHTYLKLPDGIESHQVSLHGLKHWEFVDKVDKGTTKQESHPSIEILQEVDRVYLGKQKIPIHLTLQNKETKEVIMTSTSSASISPCDVEKIQALMYTSSSPSHTAVTVSDDSQSPLADYELSLKDHWTVPVISDVVVWNAWIDKCQALDDMNDDAYFHYLCIEPGLVANYHSLKPGECATLTQKLQ